MPVRVNGLATTAPTPGDSTKIGGSKSRQSARVWAPSSTTPSPPSASTGSPSSRNSTERTVGYRVSVYTTCATRAVIERLPPPEANSPERSTRAVVPSMVSPSRRVPAGMVVPRPAACSDPVGPASSAFTDAVAGMVVCWHPALGHAELLAAQEVQPHDGRRGGGGG